jgi:hypothetical protein
MRPLILAFVLLAPFIAIAQNYHLAAHLTALPAQLAQNLNAGMSGMAHAVRALLG